MERSPKPVTVVFDLGGVLVPPEGSLRVLAAELGVGEPELARAYWAPRDDYDRGGSPAAFWGAVLAALDRDDGTDADVARLDALDGAHWSRVGEDVVALLEDLARCGTRTAVLSNAPASLAAVVRAAGWSAGFDELLFSSDVGALKPEPAGYDALRDRLGAAAADLLFFDDRPVNVEAARARGWEAHVWAGVETARTVLTARGALRG